MTESNRSSRLLEHVVVQAPDSPHPNSSRVDVAIEMQDLYGASPPLPSSQIKKERVRRRRKPKPWTIKFAQRMLRRLMRSKEWTYLMIIVIIYVLFVDDIVALTRSFKGNGLFLGLGISKMVVLAIFIIEFFMQLFAMRREYNYKSLFFWLDIIAIGSLIPDILILAYGDDTSVGINELAIARAGRAARASGRVARILRISQFYTCFGWSRKKKEKEAERDRSDSEPVVPLEPSRMGNRLINRTTNKVVVIVLLLMFVSSFMQGELDATPFVRAGLAELETVHDLGYPAASIYSSISQSYISSQPDIIYLQVRGEVLHEDKRKIDGLFPHAILKYKSPKSETVRSEAWYDNRDETAKVAGFNIGMLLLVLILLTVGNLLIIRDATKLVITPMERVLAVLKQLSADRRKDRLNRSGSGSGGGPSSRKNRQSKDYTDTSDDMTSNSGIEDDEDEAEALFGMLNDIDGNLQAARERAELEAGENQRLRYRIMDLVAEKKLAELQITGIKRRSRPAKVENAEGGGAESSDPSNNGIVDLVGEYVTVHKNMARVATASRKVDFGLNIGGRKFMTHAENDAPDIRFSHTPSTTPNPTPPPSPNPSQLRDRSPPDLDRTTSISSVTLGGITPTTPGRVEMPQVQVATLDRLIERLTYEEYTDAKFIHVFLLTYRSLLSPFELMERLLVRFCYVTPDILLPKESSLETIDEWRKQKQEPVRIGVYNAVKLWIGRYFWDFHENKELVAMLNDFMEYLLPEMNMDRHAINIETLFKAKIEEDRHRHEQPYIAPIPSTPEEMTEMCAGDSELNKYEMIDLAKQITLVEHDLFRAIRPNELLNQAWTKKNKERDSPNILRLIDHFNNISAWIKTQVVKSNKVKERGQAMKRAIILGEELVKLNNFNGAMEVLAALSNASISRLKKTWAVIPSSSQESFTELGNLMSAQSSFKVYREKLHTAQQPAIPYIGVYLSDLVFIDEGNPDTVESPLPAALVNFDKHRQVAAVISEIQKYQHVTYHSSTNNNNNNNKKSNNNNEESDDEEEAIQRNPEIIEFITQLRGIDDDTSYKTSLIAEPRARAGSSGIQLSPNPSLLQRLRNASPSGTL